MADESEFFQKSLKAARSMIAMNPPNKPPPPVPVEPDDLHLGIAKKQVLVKEVKHNLVWRRGLPG